MPLYGKFQIPPTYKGHNQVSTAAEPNFADLPYFVGYQTTGIACAYVAPFDYNNIYMPALSFDDLQIGAWKSGFMRLKWRGLGGLSNTWTVALGLTICNGEWINFPHICSVYNYYVILAGNTTNYQVHVETNHKQLNATFYNSYLGTLWGATIDEQSADMNITTVYHDTTYLWEIYRVSEYVYKFNVRIIDSNITNDVTMVDDYVREITFADISDHEYDEPIFGGKRFYLTAINTHYGSIYLDEVLF